MKKWLMVWLVAGAVALLPTSAAAAAAGEHGDGQGQQGQQGQGQEEQEQGDGQGNHFGPFSSASTDSGTCGNDWANDTFKRQFFVTPAGPGTWRVREAFVGGHFVTIAGQSPGGCEASSPHGTTITADNTGSFHGFLSGTVTGGTFNPDACDVAAACGTTSGFIAAAFGPAAQYSCLIGPVCSFYFTYSARGDQDLAFRHWVNASDDLGGNRGDIASS